MGMVSIVPSLPENDAGSLDTRLREVLEATGRIGEGRAWWFDPVHCPTDIDDRRLYPGGLALFERS